MLTFENTETFCDFSYVSQKSNEDYIKCGYLDIFKNPLCILEEEEKCLMTNFYYTLENNNTIGNITKIEKKNVNSFIINKKLLEKWKI